MISTLITTAKHSRSINKYIHRYESPSQIIKYIYQCKNVVGTESNNKMIVLNLFLFYFIQRNYQIISIHIKQKPLQLNKCGRKQKKKKQRKISDWEKSQ